MNMIVNSIIKNTIALRNVSSSLSPHHAVWARASSSNSTTSQVDSGLSALNSGTMATGIAVGVLTLVLIVFFIAVIIHYRMIRKLPDPVFESSEEKPPGSKMSRSQSAGSGGGKANTAYANGNQLYQAPTRNYNPKLERITEDISSISNSVDSSNLKTTITRNPFHQQQHGPTSQYSRRSSSTDDYLDTANTSVPTTLVNTNNNNASSDSNSSIRHNQQQKQQPPVISSENGVILSVKRFENNPFDEDDDDVVVSRASL